MKCAHCPVPDGLHCDETELYCRRAALPTEHAFRAMLVRHAKVRAGLDEPPPVNESLALLARMKECRSRTGETGCGCGGLARCALGKGGDGLVNHADCFACLREQDATAPPAAPTAPCRTGS